MENYDGIWQSVRQYEGSPTLFFKHELPLQLDRHVFDLSGEYLIDLRHRSFKGRAVVPAAVVTSWISRIVDALAGCLTKTSQPDFFLFRYLRRSVTRPISHKLTDMTASSANSIIFAHWAWHDPAPNGLKFKPNCFMRRRGVSAEKRDGGRELTSCQSTLRARRPYCTAVAPSGDYSAGRRWVLVLHVGDIITAWAVTPRDAKLNQADSPAASGSSGVYYY